MAKALLSPLLWLLVLLLALEGWACARWRLLLWWPRFLLVVVSVGTVALAGLSTPVVSAALARLLEAPYLVSGNASRMDADVVTVLAGGYVPGTPNGYDELGWSTYSRVVRGVNAFKQSEADLLVMQGASSRSHPRRVSQLMEDLALQMGVPASAVIQEPNSRNTYEHPIELQHIPGVQEDQTIAVVTSAWHLRRAVAEFKRYFPNVIGVPTDFYSTRLDRAAQDYIPQSSALFRSTTILHELIGRVWYEIRHMRG